MSINVVVKWNKQTFNCELDPSLGPEIFKSQIYSLTSHERASREHRCTVHSQFIIAVNYN